MFAVSLERDIDLARAVACIVAWPICFNYSTFRRLFRKWLQTCLQDQGFFFFLGQLECGLVLEHVSHRSPLYRILVIASLVMVALLTEWIVR